MLRIFLALLVVVYINLDTTLKLLSPYFGFAQTKYYYQSLILPLFLAAHIVLFLPIVKVRESKPGLSWLGFSWLSLSWLGDPGGSVRVRARFLLLSIPLNIHLVSRLLLLQTTNAIRLVPVFICAASMPILIIISILHFNAAKCFRANGSYSYLFLIAGLDYFLLYGPNLDYSTFKVSSCNVSILSCFFLTFVFYLIPNTNPGPSKRVKSSLLQSKGFKLGVSLFFMAGISFIYQNQLSICYPNSQIPFNNSKKSKVLARAESKTGFVSVVFIAGNSSMGAKKPQDIMAMRCDHSILGGIYPSYGNASIFRNFYFLDFPRFMLGPTFQPKRALNLGLGIGVVSKVMIDSGLIVDIVELDPVIYNYARVYFNLPAPLNFYALDARLFLEKSNKVYDVITHDLFSGGIVPSSLFSVQAFSSLKKRLSPGGIVAVNFVGAPSHLSTSSIFVTMKHVFQHVVLVQEAEGHDMMNLVFFASDKVLDFRAPDTAGNPILSSFSYKEALVHFSKQWETRLSSMKGGKIVTDENNPLNQFDYAALYDHWSVMRKIFGEEFWVTLNP